MIILSAFTDLLTNGIHSLYLICAIVGGLIMVIQFLMMIIGIGGFEDADVPADSPDADMGGGNADSGDADVDDGSMISLARFLSFRVIVAVSAFFGVIGLWADSAKLHPMIGFSLALTGGLIAGAIVAFILGFFNRLQSNGNVHLESAIGKTATVYVSIPANKSNTGKIQLSIQGRIDEMEAMTPGAALSPGMTVIVKDVVDGRIAIVEPAN